MTDRLNKYMVTKIIIGKYKAKEETVEAIQYDGKDKTISLIGSFVGDRILHPKSPIRFKFRHFNETYFVGTGDYVIKSNRGVFSVLREQEFLDRHVPIEQKESRRIKRSSEREIDRAGKKGMKEYTMWYVEDGFHKAVVIAERNERKAYTRFRDLGFSGWVRTEFKGKTISV